MSEEVRSLITFNNEQAELSAQKADELFGEARLWMILTIIAAGV